MFSGVSTVLNGEKVDGVVNVAGGWAGGNTADPDWVKNADLMWKQSGQIIICTLQHKTRQL